MFPINRFIKQEKKKIIATIIVAIIFLFFWINGPLLQSIEVLSLESIETKYSRPVMIGNNGVNKRTNITNNTIAINEQQTFGYGLSRVTLCYCGTSRFQRRIIEVFVTRQPMCLQSTEVRQLLTTYGILVYVKYHLGIRFESF